MLKALLSFFRSKQVASEVGTETKPNMGVPNMPDTFFSEEFPELSKSIDQLKLERSEKSLQNYLLVLNDLSLQKLADVEQVIRDSGFPFWWYRAYGDGPYLKSDIIPWLDCVSYNGHRREKALAQISTPLPNTACLAMILRRLNDWVPQVQEQAFKTAQVTIDSASAGSVAEFFWEFAVAVRSWKRLSADGKAFLMAQLERPEVVDLLVTYFLNGTSGRLSAKFGAIFRNEVFSPFLDRLACNAAHPSVRAAAFRSIFEKRFRWRDGWKDEWIDKSLGKKRRVAAYTEIPLEHEFDEEALLAKAAVDRSVFVRRVAGDALVAHANARSASTDRIADILKLDSYPSVVERADYYLRHRTE